MTSFLIGAAAALGLGVLTSIHPCPLATNVAAVAFLASRSEPRRVLLRGITYAIGRMVAYGIVGAIVVAGALVVPVVARFLQDWVTRLLGPVLILVGMALLGLIRLRRPATPDGGIPRPARSGGLLASLLLGAILALSFCPASAWLFFGTLVPLSLRHGSRVILPLLYGLGTALPAVALTAIFRFGADRALSAIAGLKRVERIIRAAAGSLLILLGVYYTLAQVFEVA